MIKNKLLRAAIVSLAAVNIISFSACSKKNTASKSNGTIYGKVTKVDGKNITITVGTWNPGQGGNQGTPPVKSSTGSSGNQGTSSVNNPPAAPGNNGSSSGSQGTSSNSSNGTSSSSNQGTSSSSKQTAPPSISGSSSSGSQSGQQGIPSDMITLTKEIKTITISDTSIIKKQSMVAPGSNSSALSTSNSASLSDIKVGSILKLTYTSGNLTSVEIVGK